MAYNPDAPSKSYPSYITKPDPLSYATQEILGVKKDRYTQAIGRQVEQLVKEVMSFPMTTRERITYLKELDKKIPNPSNMSFSAQSLAMDVIYRTQILEANQRKNLSTQAIEAPGTYHVHALETVNLYPVTPLVKLSVERAVAQHGNITAKEVQTLAKTLPSQPAPQQQTTIINPPVHNTQTAPITPKPVTNTVSFKGADPLAFARKQVYQLQAREYGKQPYDNLPQATAEIVTKYSDRWNKNPVAAYQALTTDLHAVFKKPSQSVNLTIPATEGAMAVFKLAEEVRGKQQQGSTYMPPLTSERMAELTVKAKTIAPSLPASKSAVPAPAPVAAVPKAAVPVTPLAKLEAKPDVSPATPESYVKQRAMERAFSLFFKDGIPQIVMPNPAGANPATVPIPERVLYKNNNKLNPTGQNPDQFDRFNRMLQQSLNILGYKLDVDGKFGPATEAAVLDFQKKHPQLAADGYVGINTYAEIQIEQVNQKLKTAIAHKTISKDSIYILAEYSDVTAILGKVTSARVKSDAKMLEAKMQEVRLIENISPSPTPAASRQRPVHTPA